MLGRKKAPADEAGAAKEPAKKEATPADKAKPAKPGKPEKAPKAEKPPKPGKSEKPGKPEKTPKAEKAPKPEKGTVTRGARAGLPRPSKTALLQIGAFLVLVTFFSLLLVVLSQPFRVTKQSMDPNLIEDQVLIVWRAPYLGPLAALGGPRRGDIVVFRDPASNQVFVKRVVALPGEQVQARKGVVWINGEPYDELYLPGRMRTDDFGPFTVREGEFFVLGDNRRPSLDSRHFGSVPREAIIGVAVLSVAPTDRLGTFDNVVADSAFPPPQPVETAP